MAPHRGQGEFCTPPCGASGDKSREKALNETKRHLGVHRHFGWLGSYYQYANRLAALYFLTNEGEAVFVYFTGDVFPDGRQCPQVRPSGTN